MCEGSLWRVLVDSGAGTIRWLSRCARTRGIALVRLASLRTARLRCLCMLYGLYLSMLLTILVGFRVAVVGFVSCVMMLVIAF